MEQVPFSPAYLAAFARTMGHEGRYSNNPNDRGGETMWGITERVARVNGFKGRMIDLPQSTAQEIAKTQYWDILNLDLIAPLSALIAQEMFDTIYNGGEPGQWLQRALNVFNRQQVDYADLKVDGRIGPFTVDTLRQFLAKRGKLGETVMVNTLNTLQGERFVRIAENNPTQEDFVFGWILNRCQFVPMGGLQQ